MQSFRSVARQSLLSQCRSPIVARAVAIHTTRPSFIGPAGPQNIVGTVNDPVRFPEPNKAHGAYHWAFERALSVALIPLTIAPFATGSLNPVTDALLASTIIVHSHIGFESCIHDYIPTRKYGSFHKFAIWLLYAVTATVFVGTYEFQTNDVGLTEAIKRIWTAKGTNSESLLHKAESKLGL